MPKTVNIAEAKAHLSQLIERVLKGEEIVIARRGKPVARLKPVAALASGARFGFWRGAMQVPSEREWKEADEVLAADFDKATGAPSNGFGS